MTRKVPREFGVEQTNSQKLAAAAAAAAAAAGGGVGASKQRRLRAEEQAGTRKRRTYTAPLLDPELLPVPLDPDELFDPTTLAGPTLLGAFDEDERSTTAIDDGWFDPADDDKKK